MLLMFFYYQTQFHHSFQHELNGLRNLFDCCTFFLFRAQKVCMSVAILCTMGVRKDTCYTLLPLGAVLSSYIFKNRHVFYKSLQDSGLPHNFKSNIYKNN